MTIKEPGDTVVYQIALNEHPLTVGEDDDRSDHELVEAVDQRTRIADEIDWPEWTVFTSDPPDMETLRYVNTATRINVATTFETGTWGHHTKQRDVFDAITDHIEIEDWNIDNASMSHPSATHIDDFEGEIHLDLTDENREPEEPSTPDPNTNTEAQ